MEGAAVAAAGVAAGEVAATGLQAATTASRAIKRLVATVCILMCHLQKSRGGVTAAACPGQSCQPLSCLHPSDTSCKYAVCVVCTSRMTQCKAVSAPGVHGQILVCSAQQTPQFHVDCTEHAILRHAGMPTPRSVSTGCATLWTCLWGLSLLAQEKPQDPLGNHKSCINKAHALPVEAASRLLLGKPWTWKCS